MVSKDDSTWEKPLTLSLGSLSFGLDWRAGSSLARLQDAPESKAHTQASEWVLSARMTSAAVYKETGSSEPLKTKDRTAHTNRTTVCTLPETAAALQGGKVLLGFSQNSSMPPGGNLLLPSHQAWKDEEEGGLASQNQVNTHVEVLRAVARSQPLSPAFSLTQGIGYVENKGICCLLPF